MSDPFFRFPLRALSVFGSPLDRLNHILGYCVMSVGWKLLPDGFQGDEEDLDEEGIEKVFEIGAKVLHMHNDAGRYAQHCHKLFQAMQQACGPDSQATVSIRADWLWQCLRPLRGCDENMAISYREFSVLCAILSKLGDKPLESCTWQEIQRRALGYTTEAEMKSKSGSRTDWARPLTRQQIRSTLDALQRNRFFARHAASNGRKAWLTYFSFKMSETELEVEATKAWRQRRRRGHLSWSAEKKERVAAVWAGSRETGGKAPAEAATAA